MKKITKLILLVVAIFAWGTSSATQYCQTPITATDNATTVKLSCQLISAGNYQIKIESDVAMSGLGGSFCNVNGVGGYQLNASGNFVLSGDGKTITCDIASTSGPNLYTPLYVLMPGEKVFAWPADVDWTVTCGAAVVDTEVPTAFTATKGAVGANSVELLLNATDNSGSITYSISYGTTPTIVTTSGTSGVQKSYSVPNLTEGTAYTFAVTAKDAAGNIAANSPINVAATTTAILAPTTSAPTPTASDAKVKSIYSDTYTGTAAVSNLALNPGWGQATKQAEVQIGSDNVLKYSEFNYQGTIFDHIFPVATGMKYMHLDVWTPNETSIQVFPICWNGSGNEAEKFVTKTLTQNQWNSFDIPLTDFTALGLTMTDVYQLKLVGTGGKIVYLDNIYFYDNSTTVDAEAPTAFTASATTITSDEVQLTLNATDNSGAVSYTISYGSTPTVVMSAGVSGVNKVVTISGLTGSTVYNFSVTAKDATGNVAGNSPIVVQATTLAAIAASPVPSAMAEDVLSIYSDAYTASATGQVYQAWWNASWSDLILANGGNAKKIVSINGGGGVGIEFAALDVTAMTYLHLDVYPKSEVLSLLKYNVVPVGGGGAGWSSFPTLIANQWNSVNILVSALALNGASVFQVGFGSFDGEGAFYVDNIYFSKTVSTSVSNPTASDLRIYPNPIQDQLNVSAKSEISEVIVRNLVGQTLKVVSINQLTSSINVSDISAGNYFVTVKLANGQTSTQKLVKL